MHDVDEVRFDLRLTPGGALTVHCTSRVLPEEWADTVGAETLEQLRLLRDRLGRHQITESELLRLGLLLGDALVPRSIQQPLVRRVSGAAGDRLRLRIVAHDPELGALPWEYVRMPSQYDELGGAPLALDERVSLVRSPAQGVPTTAPTLRGASELRVLHASATSVPGFDRLRGDDHAVDLALWGDAARRTRRVVVDRLSDPATRESLEEALAAGPDLLVLTGHSTHSNGRPCLVLAGEHGDVDLVSGAELAAILVRHNTPLVVLNACDTATSGDAETSLAEHLVRSGVSTTIGMQMPISDSNAGHFAVGLIGALGEGEPVDVAVTQGRRRVAERAGYAEWGIPTLVASGRMDEAAPDPAELRGRAATRSGTKGTPAPHGSARTSPVTARAGADGGHGAPSRRLAPRSVSVIALVVALLVGGISLARGGDEERAAADGGTEVAGISNEDAGRNDPALKALEEQFPDDGFLRVRPSNQDGVVDTTPQLQALGAGLQDPMAGLGFTQPLPPTDAKEIGWPTSPVVADYAGTNAIRNSECHRMGLTDLVGTGASQLTWLDPERGRMVLLRLVQFSGQKDARRYYWAASMHAGLSPRNCAGWPENGLVVNPESLEVTLQEFDVTPSGTAGRPDDLLTTKKRNFSLDDGETKLASVHLSVFRYEDTVALAMVTSDTEVVPEGVAREAIGHVLEAVAP